ncbi:gibberellin-regulated protein 14 [Carica papaya]|uniref:gibberellin-regulated protein 14 n=1 Tax=Carica papaya TaxID=3649 RepID=UPI000B8D1000|nr:gibberellin-regulated protein 14 [Carica papaya]
MATKPLPFLFATLLLLTSCIGSNEEELKIPVPYLPKVPVAAPPPANIPIKDPHPAPPVKPPTPVPPVSKPPTLAPPVTKPPVPPVNLPTPAPPVSKPPTPSPPVSKPPTPSPPVTKPPAPPIKAPSPAPPVQVPTPAPPVKPPTPVPPVNPPTLPPRPPPVRTRLDCFPLCGQRCKLHSRKNLCVRACVTCCSRCKCVPPGTYGNREVCGKCYTDMTTHGNRIKCP